MGFGSIWINDNSVFVRGIFSGLTGRRRGAKVAGLALALLMPVVAQAQSFSNDDRSCNQYGAWAVSIILLAQSQGCDVKRANEWLDPTRHANWCRGQSLATMIKAPDVHRNGVTARCAQQGVKVNVGTAAPAAAPAPKGIRVVSATYGASCGVPAGNATGALGASCNGRAFCDYTISYKVLGDPAPNCKKNFVVRYSCSGKGLFEASVPAEAGLGSKVALICN